MPRVFGKPGTRKYRGKMVAQMVRANFCLEALVRYDTAKPFLSPQQRTNFQTAATDLGSLLAAKNT